jgi:hypothetical protein
MVRSLTILVLALFVAFAPANPLLAVTPDTAAVVLEIAPDAGMPSDLVAALAGLGWETHLDTLLRVAALLDAELPIGEGAGDLFGELLDEIAFECPALATALDGIAPAGLFGDALVSLHLSPFNPVPQVLAIARPSDAEGFAALQDAVIGCFGGGALDQDGVPLHIVFDGSELPLVLARHQGYFFAASDPNLSRWVVRQIAGAGEANLATAPLGQAFESLTLGGWGIGADLSSLAGLIDLFGEAVPPELMPVLEVLRGTLTSIGAVAARIGWDADGLRAEAAQYAPFASGTSALDRLMRDPRSAPMPPFLPQGSVAISSHVVPWNGIFDAIDELLVPASAALGESLDVRLLAMALLGIDLDRAWLAWAGDSVQTVTLAPLGTDLGGWLQGAPTLVTVPVRDEAAARAAIPDLVNLISVVGGLIDEASSGLFAMADPFAPAPLLPPADQMLVTTEIVHGVQFDRVRFGPTVDLGITVLDGHLLLISPMRAALGVMQHRDGFGSLNQDPAWAEVLAAWPTDARSVSLRDTQMELWALSDLADLLAQPLAWLLQLGLQEAVYGGSYSDDWSMGEEWWWDDGYNEEWWLGADGLSEPSWYDELYDVDIASLRPAPLVIGYTVDGQLTADDPHRLYDLLSTAPGMIVEVEMLSPDYSIDTYLYVLDADSGTLLFQNDDAPSTDRSFIAFAVEPGIRYQVLASSYGGWQSGNYTLSVSERVEFADAADAAPLPDADGPVEDEVTVVAIPTFAELLAMFDLIPSSIDVIAEGSGFSSSVTRHVNGITISRFLFPLR